MTRFDFSPKTKLLRWDFAKGHCEICHLRIIGMAEYHHEIPWEISRDSSFENCRCVHKKCHRIVTSERDAKVIAKVKRIERKFKGVTRSKRKIQNRGFEKRNTT